MVTAPYPGDLLDPNINNAPSSSMKLGIMLHDDTSAVSTDCAVLHIARLFKNEVQLVVYDVHFISHIVAMRT